MQVSCQCGEINFKTLIAKPIKVYHCHCRECQKQSASAFGTSAIFPASCIPLDDDLRAKLVVWTRPTDSGNTMDCYFCKICGVRLFHKARERDTISVKGGCIDGLDWSGTTHIWCKNAVVAIPEGAGRWDQEPEE